MSNAVSKMDAKLEWEVEVDVEGIVDMMVKKREWAAAAARARVKQKTWVIT
jgi:hypothetical protein